MLFSPDGILMLTPTKMSDYDNLRDKEEHFSLHLSVMISAILPHLIIKWVIVINTQVMTCLNHFLNKDFS